MRRIVIAAVLTVTLAVTVGLVREHRLRAGYDARLAFTNGRLDLLRDRIERIERTSRAVSKDWDAQYEEDAAPGDSVGPSIAAVPVGGPRRGSIRMRSNSGKDLDVAPDGTVTRAPLSPNRLRDACGTCLIDPTKAECEDAVLQYMNQQAKQPKSAPSIGVCEAAEKKWADDL